MARGGARASAAVGRLVSFASDSAAREAIEARRRSLGDGERSGRPLGGRGIAGIVLQQISPRKVLHQSVAQGDLLARKRDAVDPRQRALEVPRFELGEQKPRSVE